MNKTLSQRAFTVVELLLYMGLVSILLLVLTQIFSSSIDVKLESQATSSVDQDSRFILARLMYDIGRSDSVTIPANPGDTSNLLSLNIGSESVTYSLQNGDLLLSGSNLNSFNTSITSISFQRIGDSGGKPTIQVSFTIQSKITKRGLPEQKTIDTTIGLR